MLNLILIFFWVLKNRFVVLLMSMYIVNQYKASLRQAGQEKWDQEFPIPSCTNHG